MPPPALTGAGLRGGCAYIQAHLAEPLPLARLAAVAQQSPFHFARLFTVSTGYAPAAYVRQQRLERAQWILRQTDHPLSQIAREVGCADQSHLTALFRTYYGCTPAVYRGAPHEATGDDALHAVCVRWGQVTPAVQRQVLALMGIEHEMD